ncbi:hypothetical protein CS542_03045 [Pedobacter sp. IW39]|nr:hypothetical protein CS542_03045 [Pedobacter sp. IW39]
MSWLYQLVSIQTGSIIGIFEIITALFLAGSFWRKAGKLPYTHWSFRLHQAFAQHSQYLNNWTVFRLPISLS